MIILAWALAIKFFFRTILQCLNLKIKQRNLKSMTKQISNLFLMISGIFVNLLVWTWKCHFNITTTRFQTLSGVCSLRCSRDFVIILQRKSKLFANNIQWSHLSFLILHLDQNMPKEWQCSSKQVTYGTVFSVFLTASFTCEVILFISRLDLSLSMVVGI